MRFRTPCGGGFERPLGQRKAALGAGGRDVSEWLAVEGQGFHRRLGRSCSQESENQGQYYASCSHSCSHTFLLFVCAVRLVARRTVNTRYSLLDIGRRRTHDLPQQATRPRSGGTQAPAGTVSSPALAHVGWLGTNRAAAERCFIFIVPLPVAGEGARVWGRSRRASHASRRRERCRGWSDGGDEGGELCFTGTTAGSAPPPSP